MKEFLICSRLQFGYMNSVKGPERAWREIREKPSGLHCFLKPLDVWPLFSKVNVRWQRRVLWQNLVDGQSHAQQWLQKWLAQRLEAAAEKTVWVAGGGASP